MLLGFKGESPYLTSPVSPDAGVCETVFLGEMLASATVFHLKVNEAMS
jgi:hypothetical protein